MGTHVHADGARTRAHSCWPSRAPKKISISGHQPLVDELPIQTALHCPDPSGHQGNLSEHFLGTGPCTKSSGNPAPKAAKTSEKPSPHQAVHRDREEKSAVQYARMCTQIPRSLCELYKRTALITTSVPRGSLRTVTVLKEAISAQQVSKTISKTIRYHTLPRHRKNHRRCRDNRLQIQRGNYR